MGRRFEEVSEETKRVPYKVVRGDERRRRVRDPRQEVTRRPRVGAKVLHEAEEGRRGLPGREGHRGGHHRPGVLQRRPAPGDQGRRPHRRPRRQAHRQRADRGRARLRPRQEQGRSSSPSTTSAAARSTSRSSRSARRSSRSSRPTATRTSAATTSTTCVMDWLIAEFKKDTGIDVSQGQDGPPAPARRRRRRPRSSCRSVQETEINLPFLTADATGPKHLQIKLSRAKLEQMMRHLVERAMEPVQEGARRRGQEAGGHRTRSCSSAARRASRWCRSRSRSSSARSRTRA